MSSFHIFPDPWPKRQVTLALVTIGRSPKLVARLLKEMLNLSITDLEALEESLPLVLFESLEWKTANDIYYLFRKAGAGIELRRPHQRKLGVPNLVFRRIAA